MTVASDVTNEVDPGASPRPLARAWLWRPWYAKVWWAGMVAYWAGAVVAASAIPLEAFYDSALAGFLNIMFFPPTILMILGLGFAALGSPGATGSLSRRPMTSHYSGAR